MSFFRNSTGRRARQEIAAAGRRMGMSYRRAWLLAKTMNACFRKPLVEATKGGVGGGGARLTPVGREVLALYRAMEDHAATAVVPDMEKLRSLMADSRRRTEPGVRYEQNTISGLISACGQFAEYSGL
jgi:molybdate transport system regulatory protein